MTLRSLQKVDQELWNQLSHTNVFFGHKSVGYNILSGIEEVENRIPTIKLRILETKDPRKIQSGVFAHARIGHNGAPLSKVREFRKIMENGIGEKVSIAMMKFCFIDFDKSTDLNNVFTKYSETVNTLQEEFPNVTFVHVTVPLLVQQRGIKAAVKRLLRRPVTGIIDNVKRCEFNRMLKQVYEGKEPIFDLARIESTREDGSRVTFLYRGKEYYAMASEYTDDGGHLNETGQLKVACGLLCKLVEVLRNK